MQPKILKNCSAQLPLFVLRSARRGIQCQRVGKNAVRIAHRTLPRNAALQSFKRDLRLQAMWSTSGAGWNYYQARNCMSTVVVQINACKCACGLGLLQHHHNSGKQSRMLSCVLSGHVTTLSPPGSRACFCQSIISICSCDVCGQFICACASSRRNCAQVSAIILDLLAHHVN